MKKILMLSFVIMLSHYSFGQWGGSGSIYYNSGNVGIGTTTPQAQLHINNNSGQSVFRIGSTTYSILQVIPGNDNNYAYLDLGLNDVTKFGWQVGKDINGGSFGGPNGFYICELITGGSVSRLSINKGGNVGIGTTNPGIYKLAVNGNIRAKEIKVETGWSDFVFEPDYQLRSLKETENYIKRYKHLPEIPSAAEVEKNGINVGEMNSKLLQKIEELTLHLIEQDKKLEKQTQLINRLLERVSFDEK